MGNYPIKVESIKGCKCDICAHGTKYSYNLYTEEHILRAGYLILSKWSEEKRLVFKQLHSDQQPHNIAKLAYESQKGQVNTQPIMGKEILLIEAEHRVRMTKYDHLAKSERINSMLIKVTPRPVPSNTKRMLKENKIRQRNSNKKAGKAVLSRSSGR